MKIGIDIRHLTDHNQTGVHQYTTNLLNALFCLDQKNEYVLFASGSKKTLERLPAFDFPNVQVAKIPIPNKLLSATFLFTHKPTLEYYLKKHGIIIDAWFFPNHNFIATKLPYVIMAHDLSFEYFPEFFSFKSRFRHSDTKKLYQEAHAVLAPSESTKQDLEQIYRLDPKKIQVTPLAPTFSQNQNITGFTLPRRFILSLATLEPRKNFISVLEAYEQYCDETRNPIALVLAGAHGFKSRPLIRLIKRSRYAKQIHLLGYVDETQKQELYRRATVFVFPSFYEGFGLPPLEAMSQGCPVIVSQTSSLPELIKTAGILIDPYNVNDLSEALKMLLHSNRLQETYKKQGYVRAAEFSWHSTAQKTLDVFNTLVL